MKKQRRLKTKYLIFSFGILILFDLVIVVTSYAKFRTSLSSYQQSKDIAKWDVSANIPNATYTIVPCGEQSYQISVTNNSDVALTYSINVTNMSKNSYVSLDDSAMSDCGNSYTFNNVGTINANASTKTKTHTLKFVSTPDVTEYNNRMVTIGVTFKQKKTV